MTEIKWLLGVASVFLVIALILSPAAFFYGLIGGLVYGALYILMDILC